MSNNFYDSNTLCITRIRITIILSFSQFREQSPNPHASKSNEREKINKNKLINKK